MLTHVGRYEKVKVSPRGVDMIQKKKREGTHDLEELSDMGIRELVLRNIEQGLCVGGLSTGSGTASSFRACPVTDVKGMIACDELAPFVY